MIAFEVILGVLTGGAVNALKATGVGAKIMAASSKIHNKIGHFGDGLADVSKRMLNDVGDVVLPESVLGLDGKKYLVKRNDLMDNDRPQNMKMDGDKDGGGKKLVEERKQKEAEDRKQKEEVTNISSRLKNRIKDQDGFVLKHTDEELKAIVQEAKNLKLSDTEIDDLLYISCREAKPISSSELIQQMDNWVNVVQKRGYPHKFASLEEFQQFSGELKKGLKALGIDSGDVRVQGSSLRTPGAGDVDLVAMVSQNDFDSFIKNKFNGKIEKNGKSIEISNLTTKELNALAKDITNNKKLYNSKAYSDFRYTMQSGIINAKGSKKIITGFNEFKNKLKKDYPNLNIENIAIQPLGSNFDLEPFFKL
jgi:hypothetical protein